MQITVWDAVQTSWEEGGCGGWGDLYWSTITIIIFKFIFFAFYSDRRVVNDKK